MSANLARIRELREKSSLSQAAVAEQLGYQSAVGYCRLETGKRRLRVEHITVLAQLFGVPVADLLTTASVTKEPANG